MANGLSPFNKIAVARIIAPPPQEPVSGPQLAVPGGQEGGPAFEFQFWPETLRDSKAVEYSEKLVPGGSHPLYQWIRGGARRISFTAVFVKELEGVVPPGKYIVDINAAIWALRRFLYPSYGTADFKAFPPEFLKLELPNTAIGGYDENGPKSSVNCIMMGADVEYRSWFPSGEPRFATVDLEFAEVVQGSPFEPADIRFVDRMSFAEAWKRYVNKMISGPKTSG